MSLEKYNAVILEWLIQSNAHEEEALRFWRELGAPSGIDSSALEEMLSIKQCIHAGQFSRAFELLTAFAAVPEPVLQARGVQAPAVADAKFRLALAELVQLVEQRGPTEPLAVIAFARETVSPLIMAVGSAEQRAEYSRLLSSFVSLLVLPQNAVIPNVEKFKNFEELESWILEAVNCLQENRAATARLSNITNCYKLICDKRK